MVDTDTQEDGSKNCFLPDEDAFICTNHVEYKACGSKYVFNLLIFLQFC